MKQIASLPCVMAIGIALLARGAQGQIDSPAPPLMGQPSYHLYSVPGVTSGGATETFFRCTNTTDANIRVGVEVFDIAGNLRNDASATSLDFFPGGSWGFATDTAFAVGHQSVLSVGPVSVGSARILATEPKGIICTAFLGDPINGPPSFMTALTIVKKTKQKGD